MAAFAAFYLPSRCSAFLSPNHKAFQYQSHSLHLQVPALLNHPFSSSIPFPIRSETLPSQFFSAISVQENQSVDNEKENPDEKTPRVCVINLPWDLTEADIRSLFSQSGTVKDVELMKQKNGKSRGFAFVAMESLEEAQAAVENLNSFELQGRIIRVEFASSKKKRSPPPTTNTGEKNAKLSETVHKIYVSNLAWKVRSSHLREFFAANYDLVSARVVFDSPSGKSAGYGFVSFPTKEEADAAVSTLDGKELMGRPVRLKISQKAIQSFSQ